jgi:NAD(P)-dependent dehydrogenase (short-subunit alcohol dehydrogenase family)
MKIPKPSDGIAWVTGASTGIGREVAVQLVAAGWTVAVSARSQAGLESLAALHPGRIIPVALDVTDGQAVAAAVASMQAQAGRPVVRAIFSAGTYLHDTAKTFDIEKFKTQVDVNLTGTANCLAAILPAFLSRGSGQIGMISSLSGLSGLPGAVTYSTTKAGLIAMGQSLNFDLRKAGIGMSVILPGFVKTPLTAKNEFPMPFLMAVEDAARASLSGLDAGKFLIAFPGKLAWPLRFMRLLPASIYFPLMAKATKW